MESRVSRKAIVSAFVALAFITGALLSGRLSAASGLTIGEKMADFNLKDSQGRPHSLNQSKGRMATAVIFIATRCPYSNAFNHVMAQLHNEYQSKGVAFIGINSNKTEPANEVGEHARTNGLNFLILKDEGNVIAVRLAAQVTPEVFVLDSNMVLRYHGAIGNSKNPTTRSSEAKSDEIRSALDAVLSGGSVKTAQTKAFGCTIKR